MRKVEDAEKATSEAEKANNLIQQELERQNDLRAQIAEVEDELRDFQFKQKSKSCPSTPSLRSFTTSSQKSGSPPRNSKQSMRFYITDTQYKLSEYEDLLGFIFTPPEISPHLAPREEEIIAMIYNSTYDDFVKLANQKPKTQSKSRKRSKKNGRLRNNDINSDIKFLDVATQSQNNDEFYMNQDQLESLNQNPEDGFNYGCNDQFTEDNDQLLNDSNFDYDINLEDDDQFDIYDQYDTSSQLKNDIYSENDDTIDELFLTLPDSFSDVFRNYLPRRIFKTVMWLKQLPKKFRKQNIPMKRKMISVLRVARHEISLLSARIAFLERRKFASSSPKRFNGEIHRYEIQLLILANEMKRFRFS